MTSLFAEFKGKWIPVFDWQFFRSRKAGRDIYNAKTWTGWKTDWEPVAKDCLGDPIIVDAKAAICKLPHDTGANREPFVITANANGLAALMRSLIELPFYPRDGALGSTYSDDIGIAELKDLKRRLGALRRTAPRRLKDYFEDEIEAITERISDLRFAASKRGQFLKVCEEFAKKCYKELRVDGKYVSAYIGGCRDKPRLRVSGWLREGETPEEIQRVVERNSPPFPVDYGPFTPDDT